MRFTLKQLFFYSFQSIQLIIINYTFLEKCILFFCLVIGKYNFYFFLQKLTNKLSARFTKNWLYFHVYCLYNQSFCLHFSTVNKPNYNWMHNTLIQRLTIVCRHFVCIFILSHYFSFLNKTVYTNWDMSYTLPILVLISSNADDILKWNEFAMKKKMQWKVKS